MLNRLLAIMAACVAVLTASAPALAYVGPGAGISAIGAAIGLIGAFGLALWAVIVYPIRRARKNKKDQQAANENAQASNSASNDAAAE